MDFILKLGITLLLISFAKGNVEDLQYQKDFFIFPSQDGSGNIVPAYIREPPRDKATPNPDDIHFYLYTRANAVTPYELFINNPANLANSRYIKKANLVILCHGFSSSFTNPFPANMRTRYLETYDAINVIVIDWSVLAKQPWYFTAAENVPLVGNKTGALIDYLLQQSVTSLDLIRFVGHSLGAHVGGVTGRSVKAGKIHRLSGLDPANPLFSASNPNRISANDASYVDIIHTSGNYLGIQEPLGDSDFYPNGGEYQNGCGWDPFGVCRHARAHEYYLESIVRAGPALKFKSCRCTGCEVRDLCYDKHFLLGKCNCPAQPVTQMGERVLRSSSGKYFLNTNSASPFSLENRRGTLGNVTTNSLS